MLSDALPVQAAPGGMGTGTRRPEVKRVPFFAAIGSATLLLALLLFGSEDPLRYVLLAAAATSYATSIIRYRRSRAKRRLPKEKPARQDLARPAAAPPLQQESKT